MAPCRSEERTLTSPLPCLSMSMSACVQEILKAGSKLADTELGRQAQKLRTGLKDRVEDVREVWETSQNPLVRNKMCGRSVQDRLRLERWISMVKTLSL